MKEVGGDSDDNGGTNKEGICTDGDGEEEASGVGSGVAKADWGTFIDADGAGEGDTSTELGGFIEAEVDGNGTTEAACNGRKEEDAEGVGIAD